MISKTSRKKIAIYLSILFPFSRLADIGTTWYYSPELMYEANPFASSWERIWIITFVSILMVTYSCYRLVAVDYNKPGQGEWLVSKIFGEDFITPISRYTCELSLIITYIIGGFIAVLLWYLGHGLRLDSINYLLSLKVCNMPVFIYLSVLTTWIISYKLLNWYFTKKY